MRGGSILLLLSLFSLAGCEKDFDEKYQDSLEQLQEDARAIDTGVDERLAEGRKADSLDKAVNEAELSAERVGETAE